MTKLRMTAVACALVLGAACSKTEEKKALPPAQTWQAPPATTGDGAQAAAANPHAANPHAANPHAAMGDNPHAAMGGNPHGAMGGGDPHGGGGMDVSQLGLAPPDPDRPIDASKYLKGTIKPSAEAKEMIPEGAIIFLSVRRAAPGSPGGVGAPLAVKRLRLTTWPVWFQLTEEDAMVQGTDFGGDVVITAWADQDGDAISKTPGDVLGTVAAKIPAKDLAITLDQIIK